MGRLGKWSLSRNPHIIKLRVYLAFKTDSAPAHSGCPSIYGGFLEAFAYC